QDGTFCFARSGHPYPLYLPHDGEPTLWQIEGSLLGVFDTQFREMTQQLRPGDKVLLYTDAMDAASFEKQPVGVTSLLAWARPHRGGLLLRLLAGLVAAFLPLTLADEHPAVVTVARLRDDDVPHVVQRADFIEDLRQRLVVRLVGQLTVVRHTRGVVDLEAHL